MKRQLTMVFTVGFALVALQGRAAAQTSAATHSADFEKMAQQLQAEIDRRPGAFSVRPRKKFISGNTKEPIYVRYESNWVAHIEQVGNASYPSTLHHNHLHGEPILTVGINRDGSLNSVTIIQSSGNTLVDRAAIDIARKAAPFDALPPDSKESVDILYITRTWGFEPEVPVPHNH